MTFCISANCVNCTGIIATIESCCGAKRTLVIQVPCVDGSRGRFENVIDLVSRLEIETRNGRRSRVWVLERTHVHRTDDSSLAMFSKS